MNKNQIKIFHIKIKNCNNTIKNFKNYMKYCNNKVNNCNNKVKKFVHYSKKIKILKRCRVEFMQGEQQKHLKKKLL